VVLDARALGEATVRVMDSGFRLGLEALARKEEGNEVLRLLWDEAWPGGVRGGSANGVAALGLGGITVEQAGGRGEFME